MVVRVRIAYHVDSPALHGSRSEDELVVVALLPLDVLVGLVHVH